MSEHNRKVVQTGVSTSNESHAIYAALIGGILGFVVGLAVFFGKDVTLFGKGFSLGFVIAILGGLLSLVTYVIVSKKPSLVPKSGWQSFSNHIDTWALAIVHGLLAFLACAVLFYVIGQSFIGATLDMWAASALTALIAGTVSYITYLSAKNMNAFLVSVLLALFLLSGTFVSMMTASDPAWWYYHFSSLGAQGGVSSYAFNATLIIAGLALMALTRYISHDLALLDNGKSPRNDVRRKTFQVLLASMGFALALVGVFVYDAYPFIHNTSASGMAVLFLIIVVALPWLMPQFQKAYFAASYMLLLALLVSVWLFEVVGYFNLTVFELVATGLIFVWLIIFVRNLAALLKDANIEA